MTDIHPIWAARKTEGLSREKVVRQLEPPVTTKTLERWERGTVEVPLWRIRQLAAIYRVPEHALKNGTAAA